MSSEQDKDMARRQAIRAQIDENLKRVYARTAAEELPDRFKNLLDQLKAKDSAGSDGAGGAR